MSVASAFAITMTIEWRFDGRDQQSVIASRQRAGVVPGVAAQPVGQPPLAAFGS
jgi:hypothetical protein